jgi:putative Holliday junction resolvase
MIRILGLDVGTKTIGVAVSDPLGYTAQPETTIRRSSMAADLAELRGLVDLYNATLLVVGYPRNMNGTVGDQARYVERFVESVREAIPLPVEFVDERLTTKMARQAMIEGKVKAEKRRQIIDQQAAAIILQGYLDRRSRLQANPDPHRDNPEITGN